MYKYTSESRADELGISAATYISHFFKRFQFQFQYYILSFEYTITQFIYSNRDVYIAIALCSSLLHSAIAIFTSRLELPTGKLMST
jgi:hypothetical protein